MSHSSQPTMKDVAREAGVALGTVSRVFNGYPVGEEYRERVEAAAAKLNYRVNNYARGLKTNKTFCIGLLMPSLRHPFFAALIDELTASLTHRGYLTNVMITNFDPDAELKCFHLIEQNKEELAEQLTAIGKEKESDDFQEWMEKQQEFYDWLDSNREYDFTEGYVDEEEDEG